MNIKELLVDRARKQKYNQRTEYEKFVTKLIKKKVQDEIYNKIYNIFSISNFNNNISNRKGWIRC